MPEFEITGPMSIYETDHAPAFPGLYVWYAQFKVGEADWCSQNAGGEEPAKKSLAKALRDHSYKFGQQRIEIDATANFSTKWKGVLNDVAATRLDAGFEKTGETEISKAIEKAISNDETRRSLVKLLNLAFPLFCSPLYIGLAVEQTLSARLQNHSNKFFKLWERSKKDKGLAQRLTDPENFAERAMKLGFEPDELFFYTLSVKQAENVNLEQETINDLIIASEWMLNRWTTPILGRQ